MPNRSTVENRPSAPEQLRVHLLGPPWVQAGDGLLSVPRRQVRALLYRLAASLEPIPREHLCFHFWPDTSESTARRNLSHLLTHLRRALPGSELLLTPGDHVSLNANRAWSDVVAFEQLCVETGFLRETRFLETLQRAVDLYRGPFLAGFSLPASPEFEAWAAQERRLCERRYLDALADLIEMQAAEGEYEVAITYAQRYLATDELAEDVHRQLIGLYAAAGDRSAALQQFERCAAALERELGVSPLPVTRAIYEHVLEGRLPPLTRPAAKLTWATLPGLDIPLVGRDRALQRLEQAYAYARAGQGQVILISGEAGIGKSRLMQEFATRLQHQALILAGAGQPGEQPLPYQPLAQALRTALGVEPFDEFVLSEAEGLKTPRVMLNVQPIWLAEASRLLPELRVLQPDLPPPLSAEPDEARTRLLEALCRTVLGLAAGPRPLLLCLDDLHWADGATLDWLIYLGHRLHSSRLLILGTYRSEEIGAVEALRHSLARLDVLFELRLAGLDTASTLQLLRHLTGPRPGDEALSRRLRESTGGNPFFLLETLRVLIEMGQLPEDLAELEELPLPDSVRQAVDARLARLSPKARQVLQAGAVLGGAFRFELVRRTAGRRELETMDGLDELVARQLLVEQPPGHRFHHELIRQAVEAALSPVRRQLLHRRVARALEQLEPDGVAVIAHHFNVGGEAENALRYYAQAVERAEALFAWREAERYQGRMLALLDRLDPDCSSPTCLARRAQLLTARAHARFLQGRLAERDADLAKLAALAEASGDRGLRLQTLVHRVRYLNLDAKYEEAVRVAEEGLALAGLLDRDETESRLLAQIGFAHYFLGQPRPALTALESALAVAGEEADPEMRGRITHILGYVYFHLGDYARSLSYQQEAYACHQAVGDHNRVAWDGLDIGAVHLEMGHLTEAKRYLTESLEMARQVGAQPAEAYGLTLLGCWELHRGGYLSALDRCREALSMQQHLRSEHGSVAAELGMGLASSRLGELAQARRWLKRAVRRARSIAHRRRLAEALVGLGLVEIGAGRLDAARCDLVEAVAVARDSECWESVAAGLAALARAERRRGNVSDALSHARESAVVAQRHKLPVCQTWVEMELGLALFARGDLAEALEHTGRAVAGVSNLHEAWIGSEEVHRAHARVLQALDCTGKAHEQLQLADAIIQAKADRIPDPDRRQHHLQFTRSLIR